MYKTVYIAAQFARQNEMRDLRDRLQKIPHVKVWSRWLDESHDIDCKSASMADLEDVENCDVFILVNPPPFLGSKAELARSGRMYEAGWAGLLHKLSMGPRELYVIGNHDCVHLYNWKKFTTLDEFYIAFDRQERHFRENASSFDAIRGH